MSAKIIPITVNQDAAWADFLDKRNRAETTGDIKDGIEAGKALRRFYDLFLTEDQRRVNGGGK